MENILKVKKTSKKQQIEEKQIDVANLIFDSEKTLQIPVNHENGNFQGFLCYVKGDFNIADLQSCSFGQQIFVSEKINLQDCKIVKKPTVLLTKNNIELNKKDKNVKYLTISNNFCKEQISSELENNDKYKKHQYRKAVLDFSSTEKELSSTQKKLKKMPSCMQDFDELINKDFVRPYEVLKVENKYKRKNEKLPILSSKKRIGLLNFGISDAQFEILNQYFDIIVLPFNYIARRILQLEIDGIIISNSITNSKFVKPEILTELEKLWKSKKPILALGTGAIFMAKALGSNIEDTQQCWTINNFEIFDKNNKKYYSSMVLQEKISQLNNDLKPTFFDKYGNIVGFKECKNSIAYLFDFIENNTSTARLLNDFYNLM